MQNHTTFAMKINNNYIKILIDERNENASCKKFKQFTTTTWCKQLSKRRKKYKCIRVDSICFCLVIVHAWLASDDGGIDV